MNLEQLELLFIKTNQNGLNIVKKITCASQPVHATRGLRPGEVVPVKAFHTTRHAMRIVRYG